MNHLLLPAGSGTASQIFLNGVLLVVGSIICAVAVNGILIPQNFLSSGFTGASLIIHY
ncbi:MAG TPA: YitT family protein, partial [Deltaproteobacteria bacterium]|nr:YitT family protein [Deltaproteobacteria bacterium]